jgi:radical SAM superfamily enzyme YgiQ (UPF0313 family)
VFFFDNYLSPTKVIEEGFLQANNVDIVGLHANTLCFRDTLRMLGLIQGLREQGLWKGRIMVGGPHTSVALETIPAYVDFVVQGEGEQALLDIFSGQALQRVIRSPRFKDIDWLPFEPWDLFTRLDYDFSCDWLQARPVFPLNTSRGCPFRCSFCSVQSIWGSSWTAFSPQRVIAEIEVLVRDYRAAGIYFREDNFTLDPGRTSAICGELLRKELRIEWACETRADSLCDEDLVRRMSAAGCRAVYLGIESGSQRMLDLLNKGLRVAQIERALLLCRKHKIKTYCSLMVGLPDERYRDYVLTRQLMARLKPDYHLFNVFVGIPSSPLYEQLCSRGGFEYKDDIGLVYLPGFDVRSKVFYGRDSKEMVDYTFRRRRMMDRQLAAAAFARRCRNAVSRVLPCCAKGV